MQIFAITTVYPMLAYIYPNDITDGYKEAVLNIAILSGSMIGQVVFGIWADVVGRRKVYGMELVITIGATICVAMSARGDQQSMDIFGWLFFWKLVMGIGIGVEYPLSAVITSESAPTTYRARMLALVFSAQPLGQFVSEVVAVICTASFKSGITSVPKPDSLRATDRAWRLITGLGAIPAALALFSRLRIPESPRYYLEIENNSIKAESSVRERYDLGPSSFLPQIQLEERHSAPNGPGTANNASHSVHGNAVEDPNGIHANSRQDPDTIAQEPLDGAHTNAGNGVPQEPLLNRPHPEYRVPNDPPQKHKASVADFRRYLLDDGGLSLLLGTSLSWFCMDFAFYGLGLSAPNILELMAKDSTDIRYWNFLTNGPNAMIFVSVGALIGSFIMIAFVNKQSRKSVQMWGFVRLGLVFAIVGFSYDKLFRCRLWGLLIVAYIIIQMFFNWGPNTTTFMLPAELFPTAYRCTCHGISSAAGKFGSVLAQVFVGGVTFPNSHRVNSDPMSQSFSGHDSLWVGHVFEIFALFMFAGAAVTYFLIPETQDGSRESNNHPRLEALDCGTGLLSAQWIRRRLQDLSLEELHVRAEKLAMERQEPALATILRAKRSVRRWFEVHN